MCQEHLPECVCACMCECFSAWCLCDGRDYNKARMAGADAIGVAGKGSLAHGDTVHCTGSLATSLQWRSSHVQAQRKALNGRRIRLDRRV